MELPQDPVGKANAHIPIEQQKNIFISSVLTVAEVTNVKK